MANGRGRAAMALAGVAVLVMSACGSDEVKTTADTSAGSVPLEGTTWVLGGGTDIGAPLGDVVVSAQFEGGTVSGTSGCNNYNGPYTLDGDKLTIGPNLARTQMACIGPAAAVEQVYLKLLTQVESYSISGETLSLAGSGGKTLLTFEASIGAEAIVGSWTVLSYYSGDAITSVLGGVTMTTDFTDADVSGNAGCNNFNGSYTVDGDSIKIGPLASTKKACSSEEISKQEADYLAALELATTFAVVGDRLDLFRDGGTFAATLAKA